MQSLGLKSSDDDARAIIAEIDKNKDGKIDFNGTASISTLPFLVARLLLLRGPCR